MSCLEVSYRKEQGPQPKDSCGKEEDEEEEEEEKEKDVLGLLP